MVIERYLYRELGGTLAAVTLVLFLIFVSSWFARLLGQVVAGDIQPQVLLELLGLKSIDALALLLPLALYLSVLLGFGRLYRDSEMAALAACGVGVNRLLVYVIRFALGFAVLVALISLQIGPWAMSERTKIQQRIQSSSGLESVAPGQFRSLDHGRAVFYAEQMSKQGDYLENVFIQLERGGRTQIMSARQAYQKVEPNGRYLVLRNGYRYEGRAGSGGFTVASFAEHSVWVEESVITGDITARGALPTARLLGSSDRQDQAELQWRLSMPLSVLLLAVLAVFLSRTRPRQGRYSKFFVGIVAYMVYSNLLSVGRAWLENGKVDPWLGMWWVHAVMGLLIFLYWLYSMRWVLRRRYRGTTRGVAAT